MISVSILTLQRAVLASIADARSIFAMVNEVFQRAGREPVFEIQLVGLSHEISLHDSRFSIRPDLLMKDVVSTDLVIIPSMTGDMMSATYLNKEFAHWIGQQYKKGAEVASLCTGAFLLAFSGLLKGKSCTTHWMYANELRFIYPSITVIDEKTITDQDGLYSSGGSNAYWNLLLHLVEKYTSREMAIQMAKYFVIDLDRTFQSPFIIFNGLKDHEDKTIMKAQEYIEGKYQEKLTVDAIALQFDLARRTFERRFKKATRHTVTEYIQRVKIEAAKKQLEAGRRTILEVMVEVGYADIQAFRDVFKRITGMTPLEYRNKYNG